MAMKDGVLYAMAGDKGGKAKVIKGDRNFGGWSWADLSEGYYTKPRIPWGFGNKVAAYKLDDKRVLWEHTEDTPIDSRALAMRDEKLFVYCPTSHLRSLNTETGDTEWTNSSYETLNLIEEPGRGLTSTQQLSPPTKDTLRVTSQRPTSAPIPGDPSFSPVPT